MERADESSIVRQTLEAGQVVPPSPVGLAESITCPSLSIVMPVYNERRTIEQIIELVRSVELDGWLKEIVVVDDCSTDGTREWLIQHSDGIRLFLHPVNRGKGAAVRTGFQAATGDVLLIQDADLEYNPEDYSRLLEPIRRGEADAVIGSRFLVEKPAFFRRNGNPFFSHYIGNRLIIWLTNLLYGFRATDYEGCYKAFRRVVVAQIPVQTDGFDFDNELVCKLLRRRMKILEVPIRYAPRIYGEGKKIRWHDGVRILWTIVKWRIKRV